MLDDLQEILLQQSLDAIFSWSDDKIIRHWYPGAALLYGYNPDEAIDRNAIELLKTIFPDPWEKVEAELLLTGNWSGELIHTTKDGRRIIVDSRMTLIQLEGGRQIVYEINRDVTRRKQSQSRLELLQDLTAQLAKAHTMTDVATLIAFQATIALQGHFGTVAVITPDGESLEILAVSSIEREDIKLYRYTPLSHQFPLTDAARNCQPIWIETMEEYKARYPHLSAVLDTVTQSQATAVLPLMVNGRSIGAVGISFLQRKAYDDDDRAFFYALADQCAQALERTRLYHEMEEARLAAEHHADRVSRLQKITSRLGQAITREDVARITVEETTDVLRALSTNFYLYHKHDKMFEMLYTDTRITDEDLSIWRCFPMDPTYPLTHVVRTGEALWFTSWEDRLSRFPMMASFSQYYPGASAILPLRSQSEILGALGIIFGEDRTFDVEDQVLLEAITDQCAQALERTLLYQEAQESRQRAEEANESRLRFLAMITHELRTPLTSIKGFTTTLLADDIQWDVEHQREFLGIIDQQTEQLADLVDQLLDLSRMQAGTMRIMPELIAVEELVKSAETTLMALTPKHRLTIDFKGKLPALNVDRQRIIQVLGNLVENAVKYSPPDTFIFLSVNRMSDGVQFDVSDQGEGIPSDQREIIFEAFRQVDRGPKTKKGAGLGLAICKGLIQAHGGQIWIQDQPPPGTTISFILPAAH